jgi:hypothetical protein
MQHCMSVFKALPSLLVTEVMIGSTIPESLVRTKAFEPKTGHKFVCLNMILLYLKILNQFLKPQQGQNQCFESGSAKRPDLLAYSECESITLGKTMILIE